MTTQDTGLLERVKTIAPGFYTERDGGDWYIVTPDHGHRIGEDFRDRDDARRFLAHVAGDPLPEGWTIAPFEGNPLAANVDCKQGYPATAWIGPIRAMFPDWRPLVIEWKDSTEARYWEMLEALPPADMRKGGFLVGEPMDHRHGFPRFTAFLEHDGRFYEAAEPMTVAAFRAEMNRKRTESEREAT